MRPRSRTQTVLFFCAVDLRRANDELQYISKLEHIRPSEYLESGAKLRKRVT